jgi:asparagine synthase (glutamine-hydrolysing)
MNEAIAHRGPDGFGEWADHDVVLGHRRLSIIDLSARGQQPMLSQDETCALVCNGEIYNYRELRRSLEKEGYLFRSQTDVEVILPLYQKYGTRCVQFLTGMFSFALWDRRLKRLVLARDRIGEKPLFYASAAGLFAFSSEPKGLLRLPFLDKRLDEEAIPLLLTHKSLPAPVSIYRGIRQLPPASILVWANGQHRQERYWCLDFSRRRDDKPKRFLEEYEAVLEQSVQECMIADVPVGVMLSGGVDSSTIAVIARRSQKDLFGFCLSGENGIGDALDVEVERALRVATLLDIRLKVFEYRVPELWRMSEVLGHYDQPTWAIEALFADRFAASIRKNVKVVLTGNGADEAFGGYAGYAQLPFRQKFGWLVRGVPPSVASLFGAREDAVWRYLTFVRRPFWAWRGEAKTLLARQTMQALCTDDFIFRWKDYEAGKLTNEIAQECNPQSLLDVARYTDLMIDHQHGHSLIPDIAGMQNGLEMRSPFLNYKVLEFAASLPQQQILPWPYRRYQTKSIMKRYLETKLPRALVYASKFGFGIGVPWEPYLTGAHSAPVRKKILNGRYLELGIFSREGAAWAVQHSRSSTLALLSFAEWADVHLFGEKPDLPDLA